MAKVEVVQNNLASNAFVDANPANFAVMISSFSHLQFHHLCLISAAIVLSTVTSGKAQAQSFDVNWPSDVLEGACDHLIEVVADQPALAVENDCEEVELTYEDEILEAPCEQETWVNRHWMAAGCGDTLMHVQHIRLRDVVAPAVEFNEAYTGQFCAGTLDWLPNLQDNCDASLSGGISTSDTLDLCEGVFSFIVNLDVADDCGNMLDTSYTVILLESCDAILEPVVAGCTDATATNFDEDATCDNGNCTYANQCGVGTYFDVDAGVCLPLSVCANPWEYCGPFTVWDDELGLCVREVISAACYFDINNSGVVDLSDLLGFLSAYGLFCTGVETGVEDE